MKLITLLTFLIVSFSTLAQVKVEIIKANEATMVFEKPTLNKAVKHLKKIILSKRRFKGDWSSEESGNIFSRENLEGEKEYFKPSNFSVTIEDVTTELEAKKAEKKAKKDEMEALKAANFDKKSSESVSEWRTRIAKVLKRIIRDARSE